MARSRALALMVAASIGFVASPALAQDESGNYGKGDWPLAAVKRPLTLAPMMLEIRGDTLGINLSSDQVGKPIFIAPDLYFGINNKFTVGLTHQVGVCLGGAEKNCAKAYNDLGLEAQYSLMSAGNLALMGHGALMLSSLSDPTIVGLDVGMALRVSGGSVAVKVDPTIYVGVIGRDELPSLPNVGPKEYLHIPVELQYQLNFQTMLFLSTGLFGPTDGFGDVYQVPVGLGALFAVNNRIDFGTEFRFTDAAGKNNTADARQLFVRFGLRL
jgi:hypothetical protein